jgi:hypothetical protein
MITRMPETKPPSQPGLPSSAGSPWEPETASELRRQIRDLDRDNAAAWRRNDELEFACAKWRECTQRERETIREIEQSYSWMLTSPFRHLARFVGRMRRSIAKRAVKVGAYFRKRAGKPEPALPPKETQSSSADSHYRDSMLRAAQLRVADLLNGPKVPLRHGPPKGSTPEFAVYFNTSGNYFFQEIALLLHAALQEAGFRSVLRTDESASPADADFHLIVAPHEFFPLGTGSACFRASMKDRMFLLNTEQPHTRWFKLASSLFPHVRHVFDMDRETAAVIAATGVSASHLPLGFVENFAPYSADRNLCLGPETESLSMDIRNWRDNGRPLAERPIGVSFVGEATPRRSAFFAKLAPLLQAHECHLRLLPGGLGPWQAGGTQIHRRTLTSVGLSQRSRIVVNIHRDQEHYFEWHRIVLMGIWQRALVLTETVTETSPFVAGRDYVQASVEDMPRLIEYYLCDPQGIEEAERIRNSAHAQLRAHCNLPALMRQVWAPFLAELQ